MREASLRTGLPEHLGEALDFCGAIDERAYLADSAEEPDGAPSVLRRLRFYARYLVVALLLERFATVHTLLGRVRSTVASYQVAAAATAADVADWQQTLQDAAQFVQVRHCATAHVPKRSLGRDSCTLPGILGRTSGLFGTVVAARRVGRDGRDAARIVHPRSGCWQAGKWA